MIERKVKLQKIKGAAKVGGWEIVCKECPMAPHLKALGQKPQSCIAGLMDMTGAVPLNACKHIPGTNLHERANSIRDDKELKSLVIPCDFKEG